MRSTISIVFGILVAGIFVQADNVNAQGRFTMSPAAYQPDSPQKENQLFRLQTGHYGRFYNCDGEEAKRNSPHICWKNSHEPQLPTWMGWKERLRHEAFQVVQRVVDGSCCGDQDCDCQSCRGTHQPSAQRTAPCGCAQCAAKRPAKTRARTTANTSAAAVAVAAKPMNIPATSKQRRRSGLISVSPINSQQGKNIAIAETQTAVAPAQNAPAQNKRSLISQLRAKSPAFRQPQVAEARPELEPVQESATSLSLLDRLQVARPLNSKPAATRQAQATRSTRR